MWTGFARCPIVIFRNHVALAAIKGGLLAKPNYQYEKRQRDLAKKQKQEEKRRQKLANKAAGEPGQESVDESEAANDAASPGGDAASGG